MTRPTLVIVALVLCGCFQSHPSGLVELHGTDCYACHTQDYAATTAPVHPAVPEVFSTTCANCHRTVGWQPALEGKHSDVFVIHKGAHQPTACLECHDLAAGVSSAQGANTNCIRCHPDERYLREAHVGARSATSVPYAYLADVPNFCLSCHPAGTALKHPDDKFRLRDEHSVPCASCHDRTAGRDAGGQNVTCVESRCHHTLGWADREEHHREADYRAARGDGTSRNFCHQCHR